MIKKIKEFLRDIFAPRIYNYHHTSTNCDNKKVWEHFDNAFSTMNKAFNEMNKAFDEMRKEDK